MDASRRAAVVAGAAVLAAGFLRTSARGQTVPKLTVGDTSHDASSWTLVIAEAGGLFARENVVVDFVYTGNNALTIQQLVAKGMDLGKAAVETVIRADENDAALAIIGSTMLPYPYSFMAIPEISKPADLRGRRVICDLPTSFLTYTFKRWAASKGLGPDDVELVFDGSSPNRFAALVNNTVVAAPLNQPLDIIATNRGYKRMLTIASNQPAGFSCVAARRDWLADPANLEAAHRFMRALARATDFFYEPRNRDTVIGMLVNFSKVDASIARQVYDYYVGTLHPFAKNNALPDSWVKGNLDYLIASGGLKPPAPDVAKYVDRRFLR